VAHLFHSELAKKNVYFTGWNGAGFEALAAAIDGIANNEWLDIWNNGRVHIPRRSSPLAQPDYDGSYRYTIDDIGLVPGGCSGTFWQSEPNNPKAEGPPNKVILLVNPDMDTFVKKLIIKMPRACYTGHEFTDKKIVKCVEKNWRIDPTVPIGISDDPSVVDDIDACMSDLKTIYYYIRERMADTIHSWYNGMHDRLKRDNIPYIQINSNMVSSEEIVDAINQCQEYMGWSHPITKEAMTWINEYATKNYETLKLTTDWDYRKTK